MCDWAGREVCCIDPVFRQEDLKVTINNFHTRGKELECRPNPCSPGSLPWPDTEQCYVMEEGMGEDCVLSITPCDQETTTTTSSLPRDQETTENTVVLVGDEEPKVHCECIGISIRYVTQAYRRVCGAGKVYSRYRRKCVRTFFG